MPLFNQRNIVVSNGPQLIDPLERARRESEKPVPPVSPFSTITDMPASLLDYIDEQTNAQMEYEQKYGPSSSLETAGMLLSLASGPEDPFFWVTLGTGIADGSIQKLFTPTPDRPRPRPFTPDENQFFKDLQEKQKQFFLDYAQYDKDMKDWMAYRYTLPISYGDRSSSHPRYSDSERQFEQQIQTHLNDVKTPPPVTYSRSTGLSINPRSTAQTQALQTAQTQAIQTASNANTSSHTQQLQNIMRGLSQSSTAQQSQQQQINANNAQRSEAQQRVLVAALQQQQARTAAPGLPLKAPPPARGVLIGHGSVYPLLNLVMSEFNMTKSSAIRYIKKYGSN